MCVYVRIKFQVSSIILTSFRQGRSFYPPPQKGPPRLGLKIKVKRNFPYDPRTKPSNVSIYFFKNALNSQSFEETRASSTVSSEIILNIFGVAV